MTVVQVTISPRYTIPLCRDAAADWTWPRHLVPGQDTCQGPGIDHLHQQNCGAGEAYDGGLRGEAAGLLGVRGPGQGGLLHPVGGHCCTALCRWSACRRRDYRPSSGRANSSPSQCRTVIRVICTARWKLSRYLLCPVNPADINTLQVLFSYHLSSDGLSRRAVTPSGRRCPRWAGGRAWQRSSQPARTAASSPGTGYCAVLWSTVLHELW